MNSIVFIGHFFGGSFGCPGDPGQTYPYYALASDIAEAEASRGVTRLVAFSSKHAAETWGVYQAKKRASEVASTGRGKSERDRKVELGRLVRAAVERKMGNTAHSFRWNDHPRTSGTKNQMGEPQASSPSGGVEVIADGRSFRVWICSSGLASHVLELAPA
jgi:hypothetical protein